MTDWAEKKVREEMEGYSWNGRRRLSTAALPQFAAKLLQSEYKRTLRILAKMEKQLKLDQHVFTEQTKKHLMMMLATVRATVQKGRT